MEILGLLLDEEDKHFLSDYVWHVGQPGYATCSNYLGKGKYKRLLLHRLINNTPAGSYTDHINGNKLDNRKCNLRTVTNSHNMLHMSKRTNRGVYWNKQRNKWAAQICVNYKRKHLGLFNTKEEALLAHHRAVEEAVSG